MTQGGANAPPRPPLNTALFRLWGLGCCSHHVALSGGTLVLEVESPAGWGHTSAGGGVSRPAGWGHTSTGGGVSSWVGSH